MVTGRVPLVEKSLAAISCEEFGGLDLSIMKLKNGL